MKLNLSNKQILFALLYSSLFPIFSYIDMQITLYQFQAMGLSEYSRILMSISAVITLPFLILGYFPAMWLSMSIFGNASFMAMFLYICILIQVVLFMNFLNNRKKIQKDYFSNRKDKKLK